MERGQATGHVTCGTASMLGNPEIVPVVLCGGSGSRLWPLSRESFPKQFVPFFGTKSLYQQTLERVADDMFAEPVIITHEDFRFISDTQANGICATRTILLEPVRRDSGPALAAAAAYVAQSSPDALILALPSDHLVSDVPAFRAAVARAVAAARKGWIVTFGIRPDHPETGYGYIKSGEPIDAEAYAVSQFTEKPNAHLAAEFIDRGFLWNSGMFLFRSDTLLDELARFEPDLTAAARAAVENSQEDLTFIRLDRTALDEAPAKSIDVAVMERTERAAVVPVAFGWSDLGGWDAVWQTLPHDESGNAVVGEAMAVDSRNCLISSDSAFTVVMGADDLVVVANGDVVLVAPRNASEALKQLTQNLKREDHPSVVHSHRVYRPWGYYQQLDRGARYQVKRIVVNPGAKLSLQSHFHRAEHWVVVCGTALVTRDGQETLLRENESVYVPLGAVHRLANPGHIALELIEVQSGSYLEEDDIVRFDDDFNRV